MVLVGGLLLVWRMSLGWLDARIHFLMLVSRIVGAFRLSSSSSILFLPSFSSITPSFPASIELSLLASSPPFLPCHLPACPLSHCIPSLSSPAVSHFPPFPLSPNTHSIYQQRHACQLSTHLSSLNLPESCKTTDRPFTLSPNRNDIYSPPPRPLHPKARVLTLAGHALDAPWTR
ncbi:hypothetical protein BKA56DRAFT_73196 [Ilyonectria sp. MPI-CAGE-AT-0026]|nr:hypothetical protein BKA56DRAFT_73196 [Ilyonectria sp. MPI-CAGE-AT-0026]